MWENAHPIRRKKRILSLDNVHESIDSGSVARGGKEKETSLDRQILWRKKPSKKFPTTCYNGSASKFLQIMRFFKAIFNRNHLILAAR